MAIGLATALLGGASILGGVLSSNSQAKATQTATQAASDANVLSAQYAADAQKYSTDVAAASSDKQIAAASDANKYTTDASLAATRETIQAAKDAQSENNALAAATRDENKATLAPYYAQGTAANRSINALLGLDPDNGEADAAFKKYLGSTGYQFQVDEGNKSVIANSSATGMRKSGATLKALQDRGQNIGAGYFANYLNTLLGQQSTGFNAATATTGVGTNYSSQVANQNNALAGTIGNANTNNANVVGNAAGNYAGAVGNAATGYSNIVTNAANNTANTRISGANNLATVTGNAALAGAANISKNVNSLLGTAGYIYGMKAA